MKAFYLGTANISKLKAFQEMCPFQLLLPENYISPEESGETLHENAFIKASYTYQLTSKPSFSDHSGLFLDDFPNTLGVHSADFYKTTENPLKNLLQLFSPDSTRKAFYQCVLCFYLNPSEVYFFEGKIEGSISFEPKGSYGFGFDPLFIPRNEQKTFAEDLLLKTTYSHRKQALKKALEFVA